MADESITIEQISKETTYCELDRQQQQMKLFVNRVLDGGFGNPKNGC